MIQEQEVQHIAKLARLGLSEKEIKRFQKDLSSILDYIETLKQVDARAIEPFFHPNEEVNIMREDKAKPEQKEIVDKLIDLVPSKKGRHIKVKSVF